MIGNLLGVRIERGQGSNGTQQHPHRVRIVLEAFHELFHVLVHIRVERYVVHPLAELALRGKVAMDQEVRRLEKGTLFRQFLDRVAPILQDPPLAVHVRYRAPA